MDVLKKALYYNRDVPGDVINELSSVLITKPAPFPALTRSAIDIMHGVIGIITESGELAEWLLVALEGNAEENSTNLHEELGDILWYYAPIFAHTKSSFAAEMVRVIHKLQTRFPDKYVDEKANNRDLDSERSVLEQHDKPHKQTSDKLSTLASHWLKATPEMIAATPPEMMAKILRQLSGSVLSQDEIEG